MDARTNSQGTQGVIYAFLSRVLRLVLDKAMVL